jgi:sulfatase maturation enzyme AslB (radical SAM superfamily)
MCSPVSSRALLAEFASYHEVPTDDPRLTRLIGEDWVSKSHFQRTFAACVRHAEKLMFAGGEPLLVPEMEKMLRVVVDQGRAGSIDLEYVTNLTVLPERLFELWAHFRRVSFVVSLDGVGRVGELIRHPLRWDRFDQNARTLDARAASLPGAGLHANVTVQIYNVLHLDAVVDYVATALPHFGRPKLSLLFYPFSQRL